MKYTTPEIWRSVNVRDKNAREAAFQNWDSAFKRYFAYLEEIKPKISNRIWKTILNCHKLHDTTIRSISIENHWKRQKRYMVCKISLGEEECEEQILLLKNLTGFQMSIMNNDALPGGVFLWGYSEFELLSDGKMKMSLLCDVCNEYEFVFESMKLIIV